MGEIRCDDMPVWLVDGWCVVMQDYDVSLEALVDVARHCLGESNLTKFNARDFFFRAGLILLAQG